MLYICSYHPALWRQWQNPEFLLLREMSDPARLNPFHKEGRHLSGKHSLPMSLLRQASTRFGQSSMLFQTIQKNSRCSTDRLHRKEWSLNTFNNYRLLRNNCRESQNEKLLSKHIWQITMWVRFVIENQIVYYNTVSRSIDKQSDWPTKINPLFISSVSSTKLGKCRRAIKHNLVQNPTGAGGSRPFDYLQV